ncbi:cyclodeaminase/cyclohydrolase family protein [Auraticoccus monumenti]|uniref:Formiminotetrahydrofolate cyclodeaminase n=1 Tax=Auraticoccus monumenti TaxID=675864 RepID=A0A1G6V6Y8_9ACTN|nr:cyclodeaminase/cyclohydrolase family protein [Auraticoccus monumenti]SDD49338.1 Formiminotetrahydrofolate cyclodeaminase [Auraticoccus monumenti]
MDTSLWTLPAGELLDRTASADPTPGGGSVAAVTASLGLGLVLMSVEVTLAGAHRDDADTDPGELQQARTDGVELLGRLRAAADRDVAEFESVMAAYRLPRGDETEVATRREAVDTALVSATEGPLELVEQALAGIDLADRVEPAVSATVVSDTLAGRDLLTGAARAALRTADINLGPLERREHPQAAALRRRRDAAERALPPSAEPQTPGGDR